MHIWYDLMNKTKTKSEHKAYPGNGLNTIIKKAVLIFYFVYFLNWETWKKKRKKEEKSKSFMAGDLVSNNTPI